MAKKKEDNKKTSSFADVLKKIQNVVPEANIIDEDETFEISNWVSTGSYLLNAQISGSIYGGIPEGRMLLLAGEPGTGKTFISLNSCREAQKQYNSKIIWFDSEGALDKKMMERLKIDTSQVIIVPAENITTTTRAILNLLEEVSGDVPCEYFIVLDSIGNLSSLKETEDLMSGNNKRDMTKQQELKAMFRTILSKLRTKRVPMIATTHVYDTIGSYIPTKTVSGGSGAKYGASITLMLSIKQLKKEDDIDYDKTIKSNEEVKKTGVIITIKQEKARFTKGGISITIPVSFHSGMNKYAGLQNYVDWENNRVAPGKLVEEIEEYKTDNGTIKKRKTGKMIFEPHTGEQNPRSWVIRDRQIKTSDFWKNRREIFTKENLDLIDEKVKKIFEFSEYDDEETLLSEFLNIDTPMNEEINEKIKEKEKKTKSDEKLKELFDVDGL